MKRLIAIAASLCFAASALAQDAHQHADASKPPAAGGMQEHMKSMQEHMNLMREHMKTMEQSMSRMRGMMGCGKM